MSISTSIHSIRIKLTRIPTRPGRIANSNILVRREWEAEADQKAAKQAARAVIY